MTDVAIYLDLDGVLADYEKGIERFGFKIEPSLNRSADFLSSVDKEKKLAMYTAIKGTDFYERLPLMPGAVELYRAVEQYDPIILTAAPKFGSDSTTYQINPYWQGAAYQKRRWVEHVLLPQVKGPRQVDNLQYEWEDRVPIPDERFICTSSAFKHQFMHRKKSDHQILIDDRPDNCDAWERAGGIAIQHTDVESTLHGLETILDELATYEIFNP